MKFSCKHPLLIYALAGLLGYYAGQFFTIWMLIPIAPFLLLDRSRLCLCIPIFFTLCLYSFLFPVPTAMPKEGIKGSIHFSPSSIFSSRTSFGSQWIYKGSAVISEQAFPARIQLPKKNGIDRPPADCSYLIQGTIKPAYGNLYTVTFDKEDPWIPIKGSYRLAEWRYRSKQKVKKYVDNYYSDSRSAEFLGGILTGDFEDQLLKKAFGKAGLQHILAISGFHFSIITAVLMLLLRLIFPPKAALNGLILLLCSYFVFLGCGASVLRAWTMSLITIVGLLFRKASTSLNSLGLAIFIVLAVDPRLSISIGFAFSFAVTASILLFYPPASSLLDSCFPKRSYKEMKQMSWLDQHSYVAIALAKGALALSLAVNLTAIPMTLYFFGKFPLVSFIYNLIIPFLVSIVMFLFILGIFCPWIHLINSRLTEFVLNLVDNLPAPLHVHLHCQLTPAIFLSLMSSIFFFGILIWLSKENQKDQLFPNL
jgi:competence protein ComEC